MPITDLPTQDTFGLPKSDDVSLVVFNPPEEVLRGAEYTTLGDALIELYADHGKSDGSTESSLWAYVRAFDGALDTAIWRPNEPAPDGNVYDNLAGAMAALADVRAHAMLIIDDRLAPGTGVMTGSHALSCFKLSILGVQGNTTSIADGFELVGDISEIHFSNMTASWTGVTPVFTNAVSGLQLFLDNARINGDGTNVGPMFDIMFGTVYLNSLSQMTRGLYEIIASEGNVTFILEGAQAFLGSDVIRGNATVGVYYSSEVSPMPQPQANLTNPLVVLDGAVPIQSDEDDASVSWTTQRVIRHKHTATVTVYSLDGTLAQWPIGEPRRIKQYSASGNGYQFVVPSGHSLNGTVDGATGTLGASSWSPTSSLRTHVVTREAADEWSWFANE